MKIQCNVCESAEANVLCCADEAALCWACDEKVHAANKLASKHQRVSLTTSSSQMPKCDICQETVGYIFCLEDRALLCRKCDVSIHTVNTYVSAHQRFLLTGVKVGLEPTQPGSSSSGGKSNLVGKQSENGTPSVSKRGNPMPLTCDYSKTLPIPGGGVGDFVPTKVPFSGGSGATESIPSWNIDEFFGLNEFNQAYGCMDNGTSKTKFSIANGPSASVDLLIKLGVGEADICKLGDSDCSPTLRAVDEEMNFDDCLGQVPETTWMVPQISSPPTASGLYWPKSSRIPSDSSVFVPDICYSPVQKLNESATKRRRQF